MNEQGNKGNSVTERLPAQFEIVDREGGTLGPFKSILEAEAVAQNLLGEQEEDWDVQVCGSHYS